MPELELAEAEPAADGELLGEKDAEGRAAKVAAAEALGVAVGDGDLLSSSQARSTMEPGELVWSLPGAPLPCSSTLPTRLTPWPEFT